MGYRLGINWDNRSIGWCALDGDANGTPVALRDGGVRVFSDGREAKSGISLAVARRDARVMRRKRDRYLRRRTVLLGELVRLGLMPAQEDARKALEQLDPYHIRSVALDHMVPLHFLGRAIFHLNQRRGFKSNRIADKTLEDSDLGIVAKSAANLDAAMKAIGARTYGEFLAHRRHLDPAEHNSAERCTRIRRDNEADSYAFFPMRRHLEAEFDALWQSQRVYYPDVLSDTARARIARIIFFQRKHKSPPPGRCAYTNQPRLPKAHPLYQRLSLLRTLNALKIEKLGLPPQPITLEQRDSLLGALQTPTKTKRRLTWKAARKAAGLPPESKFENESGGRQGLAGDEVEAEMVELYGTAWRQLPLNEQWRILERLRTEQDETTLVAFLRKEARLDEKSAQALAGAQLPDGYGRIGESAAERIIAELEAQVITEGEAVRRCGFHRSEHDRGAVLDTLPYYGQILEHHIPPGSQDPADPPEECYGRIRNPTAHIGLGQLRHIMNAIIARHGRPDEIIIELGRDLGISDKRRQEINQSIKRTTYSAMQRGQTLEAIGIVNNGANRALLQAWEDLHPEPAKRSCIYTGNTISMEMLFSGEALIDYILPIRASLDASNSNRLVVIADAKRSKGGRTPYDAFAETPEWNAILTRAQTLPGKKRWRFAPDALSRFGGENGLLAERIVNRTYFARLVEDYLSTLFSPDNETGQCVRVIHGRITEPLRRSWKLNTLLPDHAFSKTAKARNRVDHRHRLIDAFVTAMTDVQLVETVAKRWGLNDEQEAPELFRDAPEPWQGFRKNLEELLGRAIVSHKPDHGSIASAKERSQGQDRTAGRLHNETAYGITPERNLQGGPMIVRRVALTSLDSDKKIMMVRDNDLRAALQAAIFGKDGKERDGVLRDFASEHPVFRNIRRVRIIEPFKTVTVCDKAGRAYKGYKGNSIHHIDIWRLPCGAWISNWADEKGDEISGAIQMFDAHQPQSLSSNARPHPAAKKVLRLQQNDMIALDHPLYGACICRVVKLRETGQVTLARHMDAGDLIRRNARTEDDFRYYSPTASGLQKAGARQIRINVLGRVWDPGPP